MRLLSPVDLLFTMLETRNQPVHVGGLFLFEVPEDAEDDFVSTLSKQMISNKTPPSFPFNQVLEKLIFWETDDDFEVYQHFRHIALPQPSRIRELLEYISLEHSRLLNKSNPMWECHIIEGVEPVSEGAPERFALYFKIHHSVLDGIAAMRLTTKSLSESPEERMDLPVWSLIARHRNKLDTIIPKNKSLLQIVKEQSSTIKPVALELSKTLLERGEHAFTSGLQAPKCILNQRITPSRRVSTQSYDLSRLKALSKRFSVTTNDIVLAVCSGAIRNYLLDMNALPKKPLIAFVPVSLRKGENSNASGNQISFVLANLGTHLDNPKKRISNIHKSMNNGKQRFSRMDQNSIVNYSSIVYAWAGANLMLGLYPKKQAFNLIISNVPGSDKHLYWNGAKLQSLYPASVLLNGQAMNITLATYVDKIEFGITACNDVLPHSQKLLQLIEDEITLLEGLPYTEYEQV